jgi:hypothetical protein
MVGVLAVPGPYFGQANPSVSPEVGWDDGVLIRNDTGNGDIESGRHFENHFRLANAPTFYPMDRLRLIFGIARRSARRYPRGNGLDLPSGKAAVIFEVAHRWIGIPGRHPM